MALDHFIPAVWAGMLLKQLVKAHVFGTLANTDYQGEISGFGDRVKINEIGDVSVATYTPNVTAITPENLADAQKELLINQSKYFAFKVDSVDQAQSKPKVMQWAMERAAWQLRDEADTYMAAMWDEAGIQTAGGASLGTVAGAINLTSVNVVEYLGLVAQGMDEANVPLEGRWMAIAPWVHQKIILAKITLDTSNSETFTNGFVGRAMGFDFYVSNNVVHDAANAVTKNLAGVRDTMSFAAQIVDVQAYKPEASFSDAIKGLYVYGAKVVRPDALAWLIADYTAEP